MNAHLKTLADEALKLPVGQREALVQILIASINDGCDIDADWAAEVERRALDLDSGKAEAIPLADALAQLRSRLK